MPPLNYYRDKADAICRLFWENFIKSEPALMMRDVIAIELEKVEDRGKRDACEVLRQIDHTLSVHGKIDADTDLHKRARSILEA